MIIINKIYNCDCLDLMDRMSSNFIDLTITSPPYDDRFLYNGYTFNYKKVAKKLYRVTKQGGVVVWIVNDVTKNGSETGTSFRHALYFKKIGFRLHDTMIWNKKQFSALGSLKVRYASCFEYMFIFSKGKPKTFNPIKDRRNSQGGIRRNTYNPFRNKKGNIGYVPVRSFKVKKYGIRHNIWEMFPVKNNFGKRYIHPAPFPEDLIEDHIVTWTNKNDLVFDPMSGSGTTAKMAILNGCDYICSDVSKEYCIKARRRIKQSV